MHGAGLAPCAALFLRGYIDRYLRLSFGQDTMIDFAALDHETRTVALVGRFLQCWAIMEITIANCIASALGLTAIAKFVLETNISLTNKTFVLGALCSISFLSDADKASATKLLGEIRNYRWARNLVAHEVFSPSNTTDGVKFSAVRARGKLEFPEADWSIARCQELYAEIERFTEALDDLDAKLKKARRIPPNSLSALLSAIPTLPTEEPFRSTALDPQFRQPQAAQMSATTDANPETETKTPPSRRG